MAKAVHLSENTGDGGSAHAVGLGDLRVMIICDDEQEWYAQGLEVDYIAQGTSLDDVQRSFEIGLEKTIDAHLQLHGHILNLLKAAPSKVWDEFYQHATSDSYRYTQVSSHSLRKPTDGNILIASTERPRAIGGPAIRKSRAPKELPFDSIRYLATQNCA